MVSAALMLYISVRNKQINDPYIAPLELWRSGKMPAGIEGNFIASHITSNLG